MSRTLGKYSLLRKLGCSSAFEVWEASYDGRKFALKYSALTEIPETNVQIVSLFNNQHRALSQLNHPNIISLYEASDREILTTENGEETVVMYLAFELARGDLFDWISRAGRFSDALARHYFKMTVDALEHTHLCGYAHRNLKLENLLLTSDYDLKLAGFERSSIDTSMAYTCIATSCYYAPEVYTKIPYSGVKSDIFALGVLLFIMVAGHPPFARATSQDVWYRMLYMNKNKFWTNVEMRSKELKFSDNLKDLINSLLEHTPEQRLTISQIKSHPWYNEASIPVEKLKEEMKIKCQKLQQK